MVTLNIILCKKKHQIKTKKSALHRLKHNFDLLANANQFTISYQKMHKINYYSCTYHHLEDQFMLIYRKDRSKLLFYQPNGLPAADVYVLPTRAIFLGPLDGCKRN